jgi:DNA-binding transcriptional LysR family regulator
LDRLGKSVILTQAGEQLLAHAERVLSEMSLARQRLRELGKWGHGRLRIGAGPTSCQYILPNVLREFKESFPQCLIQIEPGDTPVALELLHSNRVDLALALQPRNLGQLEFRALFKDELRFLVSPLHPWARAGRADQSQIPRERFILYAKRSYTSELIETYFRQEEMVLPSFIELGSIEAIKELVKLGLGVSILAPWVARRELAEGSLIALPLGARKLQRSWGILLRKSQRLSLAQETFIGLCTAVTDNLRI